MYVIIIGCGRVGSGLANQLSKAGMDVVVVDHNEESFNNLSPEYSGFKVSGDATEIEILKEAKLEKADAVVITTDDDNINSMIAQIAKYIYRIDQVMVRVNDPNKQIIYDNLDIFSISTTNLLVEKFQTQININQ